MKKRKPSVTIGISAFNEEANIQNLLLSLLSQNQHRFHLQEIIVVSDGSTDRTVVRAQQLQDVRIRVVEGDERKGQAQRQNEIVKRMPKSSNYLLLLEADTLPKDTNYIDHLVRVIPKDGDFGFVVGNAVPQEASSWFEEIMNVGFELRKEIFSKALPFPNVYLCNGQTGKLLSKTFLKDFALRKEFQPDSYCFREAARKHFKIIRSLDAHIYFKSAGSMVDYFLQSGKFQKAKHNERNYSDVYHVHIDYSKILSIFFKKMIANPIHALLYVFLALGSRIYSQFLPSYSREWKIYLSTKKIHVLLL